jgi:isopentenyl phosphate kinase
MKPMLLKIGGSVLTDKHRECTLKEENLLRIAGEIGRASVPLVLVHGAGSFGHPQARRYALQQEPQVRGVVETHRAVVRLNAVFVEALRSAGVAAVGVHPLNCMLVEEGVVRRFDVEVIQRMVDFGLTPVIHGDVVVDTVRGVSVVSGDRILSLLAKSFGVSLIGAGSDVDGVMDDEGRVIPVITPDSFRVLSEHIGGCGGEDVTGGMAGKVQELLELAACGIDSVIFNAEREGSVFSFLSGGSVEGTFIRGEMV